MHHKHNICNPEIAMTKSKLRVFLQRKELAYTCQLTLAVAGWIVLCLTFCDYNFARIIRAGAEIMEVAVYIWFLKTWWGGK